MARRRHDAAVMATRVGIELSPAACRIVEIDAGLAWRGAQGDTRVRSFAVLPPSGPELRAKLASLRRRRRVGGRLGRAQRAPAGDRHRRARTSRCAPRRSRRWPAAGLPTAGRLGGHRAGDAGRRSARRAAGGRGDGVGGGVRRGAAAAARSGHPAADGDDAGGGARVAGADAPRVLGAGRDRGVRGVRRAGDVHRAGARRRAAGGARSAVGIRRPRTTRTAARDRAKTSRRGWPTRSASSSPRLAARRARSARSASAAGCRNCAACQRR